VAAEILRRNKEAAAEYLKSDMWEGGIATAPVDMIT
jgi:hypothetical protein